MASSHRSTTAHVKPHSRESVIKSGVIPALLFRRSELSTQLNKLRPLDDPDSEGSDTPVHKGRPEFLKLSARLSVIEAQVESQALRRDYRRPKEPLIVASQERLMAEGSTDHLDRFLQRCDMPKEAMPAKLLSLLNKSSLNRLNEDYGRVLAYLRRKPALTSKHDKLFARLVDAASGKMVEAEDGSPISGRTESVRGGSVAETSFTGSDEAEEPGSPTGSHLEAASAAFEAPAEALPGSSSISSHQEPEHRRHPPDLQLPEVPQAATVGLNFSAVAKVTLSVHRLARRAQERLQTKAEEQAAASSASAGEPDSPMWAAKVASARSLARRGGNLMGLTNSQLRESGGASPRVTSPRAG